MFTKWVYPGLGKLPFWERITAFGGDLITLPENVVGELEVAKQDLCTVLVRRIVRQRMDIQGAKKILKAWFYDNHARIYGIKE